MLNLLLVFLSFIGFLVSSYFTAVSYGWVRPDDKWIPSFCRLGEQTCATIVFTPRAKVFGLPNSVLGQTFYLSIMTGALAGLLEHNLLKLYLLASAITVAMGIYLTYSLLFLTRVPCKLCFISHFINLTIFIILLKLGLN